MPRWFVPAVLFAAIGFAVSLIVLFVLTRNGPGTVGSTQAEVLEGFAVPAFSLLDQTGATVDETIFDGKVTIVDFIFTNCPFICPGMTARMSELSARLEGTGVQFVSFSVDPEHDTPEQLAAYGADVGADPERWRFLTGDIGQVATILRETLLFELEVSSSQKIKLDDGSEMLNIVHPPHLVLIGPDRSVRFLAPYQMQDQCDRLGEMAADLARAGAG